MLTATQVKYAQGRVTQIYRDKSDQLDQKFNGAQKLTTQQQLAYLKAGDFEIIERDYYRWYEAVKFPKPAPVMTREEYDEAKKNLRKARDDVMDGLVLGDADEALGALKNLEEYKI